MPKLPLKYYLQSSYQTLSNPLSDFLCYAAWVNAFLQFYSDILHSLKPFLIGLWCKLIPDYLSNIYSRIHIHTLFGLSYGSQKMYSIEMAIVQLFLMVAMVAALLNLMQFLLRHQILIIFVSTCLQHAIDLFTTDFNAESLLLLLDLRVLIWIWAGMWRLHGSSIQIICYKWDWIVYLLVMQRTVANIWIYSFILCLKSKFCRRGFSRSLGWRGLGTGWCRARTIGSLFRNHFSARSSLQITLNFTVEADVVLGELDQLSTLKSLLEGLLGTVPVWIVEYAIGGAQVHGLLLWVSWRVHLTG